MRSFSALQRAENSSIRTLETLRNFMRPFQCSSASRKFLNPTASFRSQHKAHGFSALQRAENSSIGLSRSGGVRVSELSFSALQRAENSSIPIPGDDRPRPPAFQCSSASRKFLNRTASGAREGREGFQCSSASRKFLNQVANESTEVASESMFQCSSASRKFLNRDV